MSTNVLYDIHEAGNNASMVDPGNAGTILVNRSPVYCGLTSTAAQTRTLARPTRRGAIVTIGMEVDGGDITLTVTGGYNEIGDTSLVFSDPGQFYTFMSIATRSGVTVTYAWRLIGSHVLSDLPQAVSSRIVNVPDAATYSVLAADTGKTHILPNFTANCTITLPTAAAGLEYEFVSKAVAADAQNWIISTGGANFFLGGLAFADTDAGAGADEIHAGVWPNGSSNDFANIVTPGAGTWVKCVCDGTNWIICGQVYSATVPTFSDT